MDCREFEAALDELARGRLDAKRRRALERHARACRQCAELLELARLPLADPGEGEIVAGVLERTGGSACGQAEGALPDLVDGSLAAAGDRELLAEHLRHCRSCSALVAEFERLAVDLPRLAIVLPEISLVEAVLARTLPGPVRLRRWWAATWPQWIRRPRFAAELAYVATLVLVVVFGTPVSPLQAMPERAVELARKVPLDRLDSLPRLAAAKVVSRLEVAASRGAERAQDLVRTGRTTAGTICAQVASWFVTAADETPADPNETEEETS